MKTNKRTPTKHPNNEIVGLCSIPMETIYNYPSDSSNQLMGKIVLFQLIGFFLPRPESFVCAFVRHCLIAHNDEYFI